MPCSPVLFKRPLRFIEPVSQKDRPYQIHCSRLLFAVRSQWAYSKNGDAWEVLMPSIEEQPNSAQLDEKQLTRLMVIRANQANDISEEMKALRLNGHDTDMAVLFIGEPYMTRFLALTLLTFIAFIILAAALNAPRVAEANAHTAARDGHASPSQRHRFGRARYQPSGGTLGLVVVAGLGLFAWLTVSGHGYRRPDSALAPSAAAFSTTPYAFFCYGIESNGRNGSCHR